LYPSSVEVDTVDEEGNVIEQPRPRQDDDDDEDIESLTGASRMLAANPVLILLCVCVWLSSVL